MWQNHITCTRHTCGSVVGVAATPTAALNKSHGLRGPRQWVCPEAHGDRPSMTLLTTIVR